MIGRKVLAAKARAEAPIARACRGPIVPSAFLEGQKKRENISNFSHKRVLNCGVRILIGQCPFYVKGYRINMLGNVRTLYLP